MLFSEDTAIRDGLDELAGRAPDLAENDALMSRELPPTNGAPTSVRTTVS
jgi:hypothetical protein